jgi:hypothetical protein
MQDQPRGVQMGQSFLWVDISSQNDIFEMQKSKLGVRELKSICSGLSFATQNDEKRTIVKLRDILEKIKGKMVVLRVELEKASKKTKGIIIEGIVKIENDIITIGDKIYSLDTRVLGVEYIFR